jgi:RNA polymerase sigma-70 factor (sigma-E family)
VPDSSEEAFEALVDAHAAALGRLAHQLTGEHDSALDLVQDVLVRVLDKWTKVAVADHPLAYARRMMVNLHLNSHRRRSLVPASPEITNVAVVEADPTQEYAELDAMWRALSELSDRQRTVLVLRHYEGLSDVEIALVIGCRRSTVRSLAARGLAALRESTQLIITVDDGSGRLS